MCARGSWGFEDGPIPPSSGTPPPQTFPLSLLVYDGDLPVQLTEKSYRKRRVLATGLPSCKAGL